MNVNEILDTFVAHYGEGSSGNAPSRVQWQRILDRDSNKPFALINFFKFNETAKYSDDKEPSVSGDVAFQRYADVSIPSMQNAGGEFLLVAPFAGSFLGDDQDWDLVAIGKYPNQQAFLNLYGNKDYMQAFVHRSAAVARQSVLVTEM
ncbi:DUF1330 domain-containing protein [Ahrensia kielensis]|uniref:DUF1330 domain-containing protein n=1 Tax=Ahrensia kielensis TaxID=76980 RepID=UPI000382D71B|nr:DUF1330 domain-containing protein [Ahrensia kielensis]